MTGNDLSIIAEYPEVNSIRFYYTVPDLDNLTSGVFAVAYPKKTPVPDIVDFIPRVKHWLDTTSRSMGNGTSKEEALQRMNELSIEGAPVFEDGIPMETLNEYLHKNNRLVVFGFDILQIPKLKIVFEL